jgi:hypothetical protein
MHQWQNLIPFGIACFSTNNREPSLLEDFSSGASRLFLLSEAEVEEFQEYLDKAFKAGKYFLADLSEWQQESLIKMVDENPYDTSRLENMIADMTKVLPADSSEDVKNKLEELVTEMGKLSDKIKTSDDETSLKLGPRLERNKTYKLDSQLPILKGTQDDNIEDWIFTVENYSLTNDIPDSKKLTVFTPLIRGT